MQSLPHHYAVSARAGSEGMVALSAEKLPTLDTAPPAAFGGPGDRWSPETLLVASVVDCLVLTFRSVARASKFEWRSISCDTTGTLERVDGRNLFTRFETTVTLTVPAGADAERAKRLLEKSEQACLITNSLKAETHLHANVVNG